MRYYISSDIHGHFDEWMRALDSTNFDINNPEHKIVILGDLFDRGNQEYQIMKFVLDNKDKIIYIKGNHELAMEELIDRGYVEYRDDYNGTWKSFKRIVWSKLNKYERLLLEHDGDMWRRYANSTRLLELLSLSDNIFYLKLGKYILTHAWLPVNESIEILQDYQNASFKEWKDILWCDSIKMVESKAFLKDEILIVGHYNANKFHKDKNNNNIFYGDKFIAIDTDTINSKKVNVLIIENDEIIHHESEV